MSVLTRVEQSKCLLGSAYSLRNTVIARVRDSELEKLLQCNTIYYSLGQGFTEVSGNSEVSARRELNVVLRLHIIVFLPSRSSWEPACLNNVCMYVYICISINLRSWFIQK